MSDFFQAGILPQVELLREADGLTPGLFIAGDATSSFGGGSTYFRGFQMVLGSTTNQSFTLNTSMARR